MTLHFINKIGIYFGSYWGYRKLTALVYPCVKLGSQKGDFSARAVKCCHLLSLTLTAPECLQSISKHKQPTFFLLDGYDLTTVLEGQATLTDVLRAKRIRLAEEGTLLYRVQKR
jgi:hypothetical protein